MRTRCTLEISMILDPVAICNGYVSVSSLIYKDLGRMDQNNFNYKEVFYEDEKNYGLS